ncbi:hypothetical protein DH2020_004902 [Rehmannia glutinosa]|uniref:Protein kinase domain-containing protein n=1 Tax=Rehmannia glutinosa TaxID=99300 RepID=A0ABR0XR16_REHGL
MLCQNRLLKCFSCLIMLIHVLIQTCVGRNYCGPSSCGNITNISYPFRLKNDPKHCGDPKCELACENNTTLIYFDSHKYLVRSINYSNYTIRLTDAAIGNDICSFPNYTLSGDDFGNGYPYSITTHRSLRHMDNGPEITSFITFINCPYPVNNSVFLLETAAHCVRENYGFSESINRSRTYIKIGDLNGSYVMDMCTIDLILMTSLMGLKDEKNVSFSDIHRSLLYGFELSWFNVLCGGKCKNCFFDGKRATCEGNDRCYVGSFWSFPCGGMPVWFVFAFEYITWILELCIDYGAWLQLALRIIIGLHCVLWLLIYKLRRRHLSTFDIIEGFLRSEGGYGSVYKGKLRSGHDVAVKVLSKPRANGQDFINEVATIGRIHHVNVVKLVGYCAERSKRALVYDFMPNGYVTPELINRSIGGISYKADVYSFGMLLMELVGLKRDIMANEPEQSSQYFPYWIYDRFNKGNDIEMGNADDEDDDGNDENAQKITRKMTMVGLWCIQMSPVDRPSMSEVVKMLESENGNLQIPPRPSESHQIESYSDQTWEIESTGSMALLADDASSNDQ